MLKMKIHTLNIVQMSKRNFSLCSVVRITFLVNYREMNKKFNTFFG